jgi:hypothetical protein
LRFIFLYSGMMTAQEALHYPLKEKDAWPDAWQKRDAPSSDRIEPFAHDAE